MPRPKVRLEDRQRAVKACTRCKASKKRCDSQQPCSNCVRRRATSSCHYVDPSDAKHHRKSSQVLETDYDIRSNESTTSVNGSGHPSFHPRKSLEGDPVHADAAPSGTPASNTSRPIGGRMLLNSKGERVYIGEFASLSFLQFLRQTIKQQMGPSTFTENTRRNLMLERVISANEAQAPFIEDDSQRAVLIDLFFAVTKGILDLYSRDEVARLLESAQSQERIKHRLAKAALDIIVSIGAQSRAQDPHDRCYASTLFSRAQKAVMEDGLEDPSIDMVRCFLLMTFYMLGACRRNAAFMYLGVASQASSALGLHVTEEYRHFDAEIQIVRLRTLRSLRVLDVIYCSILGRSYSTAAVKTEISAIAQLQAHIATPRPSALKASFEVCSIIVEITPQLDKPGSISLSKAEDFLNGLQNWSATLPAEVRRFSRSTDEPLNLGDRERTIGTVHVSCLYYFAVILVTRPFLIKHLMAHMSNDADSTATSSGVAGVADLAQACVEAAMLMANMCYEALQSGVLLKQMCILKAWIFVPGLVLGFSMFAQGDTRFDMDDSFSNAREVLRSLAVESPQAEHYYEILTGLGDVIQRRRQHSRPSKNKYVDQILTFDVTLSASRSPSGLSPATPGPVTRSQEVGIEQAASTSDEIGDFDFQMPDLTEWQIEHGSGFDFGMFGFDDFAMQISENFLLEDDPSWGIT